MKETQLLAFGRTRQKIELRANFHVRSGTGLAKVGAKSRKRQREIVQMDNWGLLYKRPLTKLHPPSTSKRPKGCMLLLEILQSALQEAESEESGNYSVIHKHLSATSLTCE